jgi:transcriptional regulator with XRE-family HTH domain
MPAPANQRAREFILQLGGNLQRVRIRLGWTQEYLAELTGFDLSYAQRVERGQVNITVATLIAFADALGITPAALLRRGNPPIIKRGRPKTKQPKPRARKLLRSS